jgi:hypothetical protein
MIKNFETRKRNCLKKAKKTLKYFQKVRANPKFKVVGTRKLSKTQKETIINGYVKSCLKDIK